ncbi:MAG: hypothetical protein IJY42_03855 [Clostridia bacterium]|nr:hypothetical protein [Clostridia bacterium]
MNLCDQPLVRDAVDAVKRFSRCKLKSQYDVGLCVSEDGQNEEKNCHRFHGQMECGLLKLLVIASAVSAIMAAMGMAMSCLGGCLWKKGL